MLYNIIEVGFMICEECSKCWLNYIEDCEGMELFFEENCKKRKLDTETDLNTKLENALI
jgi:hypothetical protein